MHVLFAALVAACAAAPSRSYAAPEQRSIQPATVRILEESSKRIGQDGFAFRFLSEDNILRQEESRDGTVFGSYSYTSPEGVEVSVRYVADALGFRAESDALPKPVPTEYPTPEVPVTEAEVRTVEVYTAPEAEVRAEGVYSAPETEVRAEEVYSAPEAEVRAEEVDVRAEQSYYAPEPEVRAEVRAEESYSAPEPEVRVEAPVRYERVIVGYRPRYQ
ncbi:Endocuticle structural glycoprotein SgAbd-2 [Amphibalanus amphitrite]|uniref:Endocuticle structural glycoprotein SgAbd-2 n=1 Tax=Amphibalanus amphitrite TaxID=1232801 RepID=A0A6A4WEC1_AMPAM|nr:Endocuticle structural glycoprotein SgAbd-2 [Amphibalanus amphitrite]